MEGYSKTFSEMKNYLIERLDLLLVETITSLSEYDRIRIRGNCNEIELMLIYEFGLSLDNIKLIEAKVSRAQDYYRKKYGGYCLTGSNNKNSHWLKDGNIVERIGDMRAVRAAYEFQEWLKERDIINLEWMREADIIQPSLVEVVNYSFEGYEEQIKEWKAS